MNLKKLVLSIAMITMFLSVFGQKYIDSIFHNDIYRYYRLYIPPDFASESDLPLVLNLHGLTSNAAQQELYSQMNEVADTSGFIVCYPDGVGNSWNSGFLPGGTDDIGFVDELIDELSNKYSIDLNRVYSCGMSNGGYHSYYLACELPNRFAAIASVTGSMIPTVYNNCNPGRSMPVLQIHGTGDSVVEYNGSATASPIEDVIAFWVANNLCTADGDTIAIADVDTTDSTTAQLIKYSDCYDKSAVHFYKIFNGGHNWPGTLINVQGFNNKDFHGSEVVWNFFKQYSLEDQILDVEVNDFVDIKIQPNPANDFVRLDGITNVTSIKIISVNGSLIKQIENVNSNSRIDISTLKAGLYLVNIINNDKVVKIGKLIVQ